MYFPYYYIFTSASHTLQKPQTKDNGSCRYISFFLIRKKEDYTLHFQSLPTFKKVPKNINNWVIDYHEKKNPKLLTNLHKKSFLFRITQSILFLFIKLKHSIKFIFVFFFILNSMTRLNTPLYVWQPLHPDWRGSSLFIPDHRPLWSLAISRYTKPQIMSPSHVMWNYISN